MAFYRVKHLVDKETLMMTREYEVCMFDGSDFLHHQLASDNKLFDNRDH